MQPHVVWFCFTSNDIKSLLKKRKLQYVDKQQRWNYNLQDELQRRQTLMINKQPLKFNDKFYKITVSYKIK